MRAWCSDRNGFTAAVTSGTLPAFLIVYLSAGASFVY